MFNYYAIEIQTSPEAGTVQSFGFSDKGECEDKFLDLRKFARQSKVPVHTVMFIDKFGKNVEKPVTYIHAPETSGNGEGNEQGNEQVEGQ